MPKPKSSAPDERPAHQRAAALRCTCGGRVRFLLDSTPIYGKDYGPVYACTVCDARVGAHIHTLKPKGSLANEQLRELRSSCHFHFDEIWKSKAMTRAEAYALLAKAMKLHPTKAHIAMFNEAQCRRLLSILKGIPC